MLPNTVTILATPIEAEPRWAGFRLSAGRISRIVLFIATTFLLLQFPAQGNNSPIPLLNPEQVTWRALTYSSRSLMGRATAEVKLDIQNKQDDSTREKTPHAKIWSCTSLPAGMDCLTVSNTIKPYFSSNSFYQSKVWFLPDDATATRRLRLLMGEKKYVKTYIFTPSGVHRYRRIPADPAEGQLKPEQWSNTLKTFYPLPRTLLPSRLISEPSLLLYYLSARNRKQDQQQAADICAFHKKHYYLIHLTRTKPVNIKVDYSERRENQQEVERTGEREVVGYHVTSRVLGTKGKITLEHFSFLGLTGDITIFMDETSHTPIRIDGSLPFIGRVHFNLKQVLKAGKQ